MQLHISCSGVHDGYAQAPTRINEEHRHIDLRLIRIAAATRIALALALRRPKLLGHNGAAAPDSIIENPRVLSVYQKRGRDIMRRTIEDVEGAALMTDRPHRGCVYCEELD